MITYNDRFTLRMNNDHILLLNKLANEAGVATTSYARMLLLRELRREVAKQQANPDNLTNV
jgi:hypothetical protein